jgi:hypothetical protein
MTKERRQELLRSTERQRDDVSVTADDGAQFWDMDPLTSGELRALLLSQERTCSTCKWLKEHAIENYAGKGLHCDHIGSAAYELERDCVKSWGCLLWEQADPKEGA